MHYLLLPNSDISYKLADRCKLLIFPRPVNVSKCRYGELYADVVVVESVRLLCSWYQYLNVCNYFCFILSHLL